MTEIPRSPAAPSSRPSRRERFLVREAATLPPAGTDYVRFLRGPRSRWWRGLLAIVLSLLAFFVVSATVSSALWYLATYAIPFEAHDEWESALFLIIGFLTVAALTPFLFLIQRGIFRIRSRWLHSVEGRFRWSVAFRAALIATAGFTLYTLADGLIAPTAIAPDLSAPAVVGVLGAVMIIPFQAAAEEYLTRGIIARWVASWFRSPLAGLLVSALTSSVVFALLHGNLLPGAMLYFATFGGLLWLVSWYLGGVESAIAIHAVFNITSAVQAFLFAQPAALSTTITEESQFSGMWWMLPVALIVAITMWCVRCTAARRAYRGPETSTSPSPDEMISKPDTATKGDS